ncbi:Hypothetical predicted protein [Olea europaea subsp. europaea]|uniref:Uncharacterized protein n=1 Tax=Olea europaea subsp. europaea TaxID=158383 RepID=A0A8S0SIG9_OLEEU|nr:Hypothetical predicted protein [Olea europaea subsp. europaea]
MHSVTNYLTGLFKFSIYELLIFLQGISPILALYGFYTLNVASDVPIGCLHVSVSDPDGYTLAGAVSGVLIAATSVWVIVRILVGGPANLCLDSAGNLANKMGHNSGAPAA